MSKLATMGVIPLPIKAQQLVVNANHPHKRGPYKAPPGSRRRMPAAPVSFDVALVVGCDLCHCRRPPCHPFVPAGFYIPEGIAAGWFLLKEGRWGRGGVSVGSLGTLIPPPTGTCFPGDPSRGLWSHPSWLWHCFAVGKLRHRTKMLPSPPGPSPPKVRGLLCHPPLLQCAPRSQRAQGEQGRGGHHSRLPPWRGDDMAPPCYVAFEWGAGGCNTSGLHRHIWEDLRHILGCPETSGGVPSRAKGALAQLGEVPGISGGSSGILGGVLEHIWELLCTSVGALTHWRGPQNIWGCFNTSGEISSSYGWTSGTSGGS